MQVPYNCRLVECNGTIQLFSHMQQCKLSADQLSTFAGIPRRIANSHSIILINGKIQNGVWQLYKLISTGQLAASNDIFL